MYKNPIKINVNDPLLAATSLEGTVIGILFEKSGEEIKEAIKCRVTKIDEEIKKKTEVLAPIADFMKKKELLISNVKDFEKQRELEKEKNLKDLTDKEKEIEKSLEILREEIYEKSDKFDETTIQSLQDKAEEFRKDWNKLKECYIDIQNKEIEDIYEIAIASSMANPVRRSCDYRTVGSSSPAQRTTSTFFSPLHTSQNWGSSSSSSSSSSPSSSSDSSDSSNLSGTLENEEHSCFLSDSSEPGIENIRVQGTSISHILMRKLEEYKSIFVSIKRQIEDLNSEKRKLEIISRNICSDRKFKLNLAQLSAFGFEDIEIE